MASKNNFFNLYLKVNDKEAKTTLNSVGSDLKALRSYTRNLEEGTEKWHKANEKLAEVEHTYDEMKKRQRALIEETKNATEASEDQTAVLQEFGDSASEAFESLMSGDLIGFQEGMAGVQARIAGATKAAWAFIATPIGATIAVLAGIALATREWVQYNEAAKEANKTTQQLTQLSGDAMDQARLRAQNIEQTFGTEFKDNLKVARNLVQAFEISYVEAFDTIEAGLIRGGAQSDEFMDSLKEYPKFFAQAGFSHQEFQRILNSGEALGMYSDKLPDAIKEFQLSVSEQTTATRDALENAFGKKFTDELFANINNGSITSKEALSLISSEAENIGLNAQEASQLTADLFRGAGEDAGGALLIFDAVNKALNEEERQLTALEAQTKKTSEANLELAKAKDEALKSDAYAKLSSDASIAWTKIKTAFYEGIAFIVNGFDQLLQFQTRIFSQITGVILMLPAIIQSSMADVKNEVMDVILTFGKLGDVVGKIMNFDFSGAKAAAADFKNSFLKEAGDVASSADDIANKIASTFNKIGESVDAKFDKARKGAGEQLALEDPSQPIDEQNIDAEAQARAEKEMAIREKTEALLLEQKAKEVVEAEDPMEAAANLAAEELKNLSDQKAAELERNEKYEEELLALKKKSADEELSLFDALSKQKKRIQDLQVQWTRMTEDQKLSAITGALNQASQAFNEGSNAWKATKITETIIATYQGAQNAFSALAGIPVVGPALGTAAAGAAVAAGMKRVQSIASTKMPKLAKGGFTDLFGQGYTDETGHEVAGVVHKNEYVVPEFMRKEPEVPQILEYLETKRKKKLGLYAAGGDVASDVDLEAPSSGNSGEFMEAVQLLIARFDEGIEAFVLFGYEAELRRQKMQEKLKKIQDRSKIKK